MSILDVGISLFKSYDNPRPMRTVRLIDFLTKDNEKLRKAVASIRTLKSKDEIKAAKALLPCITVSGIFKYRSIKNIIKSSGFMCLDFDGVKDLDLAYEQLSSCPFVAFLDMSVSGTGLFAIIPIKYPEKHREHFNSLKSYMKDTYGLEIDKACSDITRLRGYACDGVHLINENAKVYDRLKSDEVMPKKMVRPAVCQGNLDRERFDKLLDLICNLRIDITQDRLDWIKCGYAIVGEFGESGRGYFHTISQYHPKYKYGECDKQYNSLMRGGRTCDISTVFFIAKKYGVMLNEK